VTFYPGTATPDQKYSPLWDMTKFRFTGASEKNENVEMDLLYKTEGSRRTHKNRNSQ